MIKLDRIGDMVNTTPVFNALRDLFPVPAWTCWGIRPRSRYWRATTASARGSPTARGSITRCRSSARAAQVAVRRQSHATTVPAGRVLARLVLVSAAGPLLWLAAFKFAAGQPIVEQLLKPLESLYGHVSHSSPRLQVTEGCAEFGRRLLSRGQGDAEGPAVVIHASASNATKIWPLERVAAVADELAGSYGSARTWASRGWRVPLAGRRPGQATARVSP